MTEEVLRGGRGNVAKLELLSHLDQFATLATRLDFCNVASFSLGSHVRHPCHVEKISNLENSQVSRFSKGTEFCFRWLAIAMEEGHLEPSQSLVGQSIGWPQRRVNRASLWLDFKLWSRKEKIPDYQLPEQIVFYALLDQLFNHVNDKYELPPLEQCRAFFSTLRQQYECG